MQIVLLTLSHNDATVDCIEDLTFGPEESDSMLHTLKGQNGIDEVLLLSTCNRFELYAVSYFTHDIDTLFSILAQQLCLLKGIETLPEEVRYKSGFQAARHLLRVSAGIDSLITGENQILSQVKAAYSRACREKTSGTVLNKLLHIAFTAGKRSRSETGIGTGAVSISYAAVQIAAQHTTKQQPKVFIAGAGETARLTCEHLKKSGFDDVTVFNRSEDKASGLAKQHDYSHFPLHDLKNEIHTADILFTALHSESYLFQKENLLREKKLLCIDLSLPRCIDPEIGSLRNITLLTLDNMREYIDTNLERRTAEEPKVEAIIEEELDRFKKWLHYRENNNIGYYERNTENKCHHRHTGQRARAETDRHCHC